MASKSLLGRVRRAFSRIALSFGHIWLPLLLIFPFVAFIFLKATNPLFLGMGPDGAPIVQPWAGTPFSYVALQWFAILSSVLFFGALGSTVSFFSRHAVERREADKARTLIGAQIFGAVFSLILLLTFIGGLVQGSLFPQIGAISFVDLSLRVDAWAKLMVWSFIAGFSERFVPDLLNNLVLRTGRNDDEPAGPPGPAASPAAPERDAG